MMFVHCLVSIATQHADRISPYVSRVGFPHPETGSWTVCVLLSPCCILQRTGATFLLFNSPPALGFRLFTRASFLFESLELLPPLFLPLLKSLEIVINTSDPPFIGHLAASSAYVNGGRE